MGGKSQKDDLAFVGMEQETARHSHKDELASVFTQSEAKSRRYHALAKVSF